MVKYLEKNTDDTTFVLCLLRKEIDISIMRRYEMYSIFLFFAFWFYVDFNTILSCEKLRGKHLILYLYNFDSLHDKYSNPFRYRQFNSKRNFIIS